MSGKKPDGENTSLTSTQKLWASLVTGNMGLSVCAASTIGSLTCRHSMDEKHATGQ